MGKLNFNMGCLATLKLHSELSDCKFRMLCSRDLGDCEQVSFICALFTKSTCCYAENWGRYCRFAV